MDVLSLHPSHLGQLHIQLAQVGFSHCLIQLLRQEVNPNGVFIWVGPQLNLCCHLVRASSMMRRPFFSL